ncbi:MAG: hypothetical protein KKB37_14855 [Alphaproteobacteria bacterium]|nr:hypothetical protein [Alphaproteobacteria bacterium]
MLGRLLLILVQLVVGWYAALEIIQKLPSFGNLQLFLLAAVFAIIVWGIGLLAAAVLKDVSQPGPPTLLFAFAVAVIFSALTMVPDVQRTVAQFVGSFDARLYPLIGAVVGYAIQS